MVNITLFLTTIKKSDKMANETHKLFYKGKEYDFIVFIEDPESLQKFKNGDTTIPLVDIVSVFKIYTNRQGGSEGVLDEASKAELSNEFGKAKEDEIIKKIITEGSDKHSAHLSRGGNSKNDSIGGGSTAN